jgi:hypothetical protein
MNPTTSVLFSIILVFTFLFQTTLCVEQSSYLNHILNEEKHLDNSKHWTLDESFNSAGSDALKPSTVDDPQNNHAYEHSVEKGKLKHLS